MKTIFDLRFWAYGGWFTWVAVAIGGSALISAGTSLYAANQASDAADKQAALLASLKYEPIDIDSLRKTAIQDSITNATESLKLQRSLQPDVARSNDLLQKSVADQLAQGGNLPPDVANKVMQAGRVAGSSSGNTGNAAPITAALIGQDSLSLLNQRQNAASNLAVTNPAPAVGLSPQDLASATEANSNSSNNFNLAKAGAQGNLINSQAAANSAGAAGVGSSLSNALSLVALTQGRTSTPALTPASSYAGTFSNNPLAGYNPGLTVSPSVIGGYR